MNLPVVPQPEPPKSLTEAAPSPVFKSLLASIERLTRRGLYYHRKTIDLDGLTFVDCSFQNCHFITSNGTFMMQNCLIQGPDTIFEYRGSALKVARLYELMNSSVQGRIVWPGIFPAVDQDARVSI